MCIKFTYQAFKLSIFIIIFFPVIGIAGIVEKPKNNQDYTFKQAQFFHKRDDSRFKIISYAEFSEYFWLRNSEFINVSPVYRGGNISKLEYNLNSNIGQIKAKTNFGELSLDNFINASSVQSFIVIHKGKIVYEQYPKMKAYQRHVWMSLSKVIAGLLIAMLAEDRVLDINKNIDFYMKDLKRSGWSNVKVIDILNQSSGIKDIEDRFSISQFASVSMKFWESFGIFANKPVGDTYKIISSMEKESPSGKLFVYSSINTFVLGWLIEAVTNSPMADLITERIWLKIGAEHDADVGVAPLVNNALIFGEFSSTLRDLGRFGMLFTPSWKVISNEQIVTASILKKMQTVGKKVDYKNSNYGKKMIQDFKDSDLHVSYQWDVVFRDGDFFKAGHGGQGLYVSPSKDVVVAFFSYDGTQDNAKVYSRLIANYLSFL